MGTKTTKHQTLSAPSGQNAMCIIDRTWALEAQHKQFNGKVLYTRVYELKVITYKSRR
jgi:hypothetical protein